MPKYRFEQIAINSTEKKKPTEEDRFTYLGLEHLDSGSLKVTRFGSDVAPIGEKLVMREGDVLFGKRRAYQKKVAIAPFDGIFSAHGMVLRPREDVIDKDFFPLFISSDYFLDAAIKISVGSLSPTINWRDLRNLEFNLPPLDEQKKLAKVLWAMNNTMEAYKKLIKATEDLVKSQFIALFGNPLSEGSRWDAAPITDACAQILGGGTPSTKHPEYFAGTIPWVSPKDMKASIITDSIDHITEEAIANSTTNLIPANSVLMVIRSGILKHDLPIAINSVPVTINQDMKAFVVSSRLHPQYLMGYFRAIERDVLLGVRAVTADNIDFKAFQKRLVPIPPMALQEQYAAFVQQSDKSKFEIEQALAELTATYKRIIAENLG